MTEPVTTQRLLLSSADARVFEGKRGDDSVFITQIESESARARVRKWLQGSQRAEVSVAETDQGLTLFTPADKGVRFDALASTDELPVRDAVALIVQATEVVQELLDDAGEPSLRVRPWHLWLNANGRVSYETYGLPPALAAELEPGRATWSDAYRTPAFLRGGAPNATSDVFSLGATLAHLLTGLPAFDAGEQGATYDAIRRGEVTPPSLQRAEITVELEEVILRTIRAEQTGRFDSPESFGKALLEASVGSIGVASRRDLRMLCAARSTAASSWLDEHPAPLGEDDPTLIVTRDEGTALEWGDDEETHVWGEESEQQATEEDVFDPDAPATVVIARDEFRTTAPPIPATGPTDALASADEITAPTQVAATQAAKPPAQSPGDEKDPVGSAQVVSLTAARVSQHPIATEDHKTTQTRRPEPQTRAAGGEKSYKWLAMLGVVLFAIAFVVWPTSCGAPDEFNVQLALSPTDIEYRAFVDGTEVTSGRPPLTLPDLAAGDHALRVETDGYEPHEQLIRVGPEDDSVVQAQLRPLLGEADSTADLAEAAAAADREGQAHESPAVAAGSGDGSGQDASVDLDVSAAAPANPNELVETEREVAVVPPTPRAAAQAEARTRRAEARRQEEAAATAARLRQQEAERATRLEREAAERSASAGSSANPEQERTAAAEASAREERRLTEAADSATSERRAASEREAANQQSAERAAAESAAAEASATSGTATEPGFLNIQSVPAAQVFIDGEDTGRFTPLLNVPLSPGRHTVRLVNAGFDLDRSYTINIESGRPRTVLNRQAP